MLGKPSEKGMPPSLGFGATDFTASWLTQNRIMNYLPLNPTYKLIETHHILTGYLLCFVMPNQIRLMNIQ
jgi:hypothetical protein